jgi:hypothetical protein
MEVIGIIIGVTGIVVGIYPYYRSKYILRPELTIEITSKGGLSAPRGLSSKNVLNSEGNIDGNNAIRIFELTWRFKVTITNNSDLTAFYPELEFNPTGSKFRIDKINRLKPIKPSESLELLGEFNKYEEVEGKNRTDVGKAPPTEFSELELLLGYENSKKRRFYTLFDFNESEKKNKFLNKKPKDYRNN